MPSILGIRIFVNFCTLRNYSRDILMERHVRSVVPDWCAEVGVLVCLLTSGGQNSDRIFMRDDKWQGIERWKPRSVRQKGVCYENCIGLL